MANRVIAAAELFYLVAISPLLLFPTLRPAWTILALAGLAILWLARALICREPWPVTPFNGALLLFCLAIPLAVWASSAPELTIPKLTGLILGLAAFRVMVFTICDRRSFEIGLAALALVGAGIWAIGLLGVHLSFLQPIVQRLPAALVSLPGAPDQGINPNQLAGALVLLLPIVLAAAVAYARERRRILPIVLALAALAAIATLIVTRSRAGWIGFGLSVAVFGVSLVLVVGSRRLKIVVVGVIGLVLAGGMLAGVMLLPHRLAAGVNGAVAAAPMGEVLQQLSLDARVEIWSRALYALQDFPFTGVGLGTFRRVVNLLYPLFLVPPDTDIGHAHNIFLQVGVDLGLGGLIAYLALLVIAGVTMWQTARTTGGLSRYVALGLVAALVGLHVYGLADALALGSKPSVALWMILGLIAALANRHGDRAWQG